MSKKKSTTRKVTATPAGEKDPAKAEEMICRLLGGMGSVLITLEHRAEIMRMVLHGRTQDQAEDEDYALHAHSEEVIDALKQVRFELDSALRYLSGDVQVPREAEVTR